MNLRNALLLALFPITAFCAGERLIGVWEIDRAKTLEHAANLSDKERQAIEADPAFFDHFKIIFDGQRVRYETPDHVGEMDYRVVIETKDCAIIECPAVADEKEKRQKAMFTDTGICITYRNFRLYLRKTNERPNKASEPTATNPPPSATSLAPLAHL